MLSTAQSFMASIAFLFLTANALYPGEPAPAPASRPSSVPQRLAGETLRSDSRAFKDISLLRAALDEIKGMGFNVICIDIPWGIVEKRTGQYDFSWFDARLREIVQRGFWVQIKISLLDRGRGYPGWLAEDDRYCKLSFDGGVDEPASLTYASKEINRRLARFLRAVAEHYRDLPVVNYSPFVSVAGETEYHHAYYQDYSEFAEEGFREFLLGRYKTLAGLNAAWKTTYANIDEVRQPVPKDPTPPGVFDFDPKVVDFFRSREECMDQYFRMFAESIHAGDPKAKVALTLGRIFGPECARRNTFSAYRWLRHGDVLWTDPSPDDCYPIHMAAARAAYLLGKPCAIELAGANAYVPNKVDPLKAFPEQSRVVYQSGGALLTTANWDYAPENQDREPTDFHRYAAAHRAMAAAMAPGISPALPPATEAVYASKWTLFAAHGYHVPYMKIEKAFLDLYGNGERLVDVVSDDLFIPDPSVLKRYARIHIPCAPVVSDAAFAALKKSGVPLVAEEPWGVCDEYGKKR